jgi:hypothetical protein
MKSPTPSRRGRWLFSGPKNRLACPGHTCFPEEVHNRLKCSIENTGEHSLQKEKVEACEWHVNRARQWGTT